MQINLSTGEIIEIGGLQISVVPIGRDRFTLRADLVESLEAKRRPGRAPLQSLPRRDRISGDREGD